MPDAEAPWYNQTKNLCGVSGKTEGGTAVKERIQAVHNEKKKWALRPLRERLGLKEDPRILCFSTDGDTDRENYRRIVWDRLYPNE